ncbi:hypothetical protein [Vibrio parahaemolyticus]|uniref:hypothetical protein n=1 Tax=Vibrio parahaemolyticus TaxID=670 RepID=UPI0037506F1C
MNSKKIVHLSKPKGREFYNAQTTVIAIGVAALGAFVSFGTNLLPLWLNVVFTFLAGVAGFFITADISASSKADENLKTELKAQEKTYLIAYSQSPEASEKERKIAIEVLNEKYEGWSL